MADKKYIVALEIGSSHIAGVVALVKAPGDASPVCYHEVPIIECVRYGSIVNVDEVCSKTNELLQRICHDPHIAPRKIDGVYLAFGGRSLHTEAVEIDHDIDDTTPISRNFIDRLRQEAAARYESANVIDIIPGQYELDGASIANPVGSIGKHLHVVMNVVLCRQQMRRNMQMVFERLKIKVCGFIVTPIAASRVLLTSEERRLGCAYVDLGAETTTVATFKDNHLTYLSVLPMGSRNITRDICSLNVLEEQAEKIKRNYGDAMPPSDSLPHGDVAGIPAADVANYVSSRAGEIIQNVSNQLLLAKFPEQRPIVATGRGMRLKNISLLLQDATKCTVRIGQFPGVSEGLELAKIPQLLSVIDTVAEDPASVNCMSIPPMPEYADPNREEPEEKEPERKPVEKKEQKEGNRFLKKFWKKIGDSMSAPDDEM